MHFTTVFLAALCTVASATPVPEPGPDAGAAFVPGVNITNAGIAGTAAAVKDSYIVVLKDDVSDSAADKYEQGVGKKLGKAPKDTYKGNGFKGFHLETDKAGLGKVANDPLVAFVEIDGIASVKPIVVNTKEVAKGGSASTLLVRNGATWGLGRISHRVRGYFNYFFDSSGCSGTRIYIIDTGIRATHTEFKYYNGASGTRAIVGKNFVTGTPNVDQHGHGTHCAGSAAGRKVGVCRSAKVIGVKVLDAAGNGPWSRIIAGLQWAANDAISKGYKNKAVISMSLGGGYSASVNAAVQGVIAKGIPVVVAAGNDNQNVQYVSPASAPNAVTVAASDFYDERAWFSNWGPGVDIFAPGVTIYSSWPTSDTAYNYLDGTSQATPHVAGLTAYLLSKTKITGPANLRNKLVTLSTKNKVIGPNGSPNRLAYNGSGK